MTEGAKLSPSPSTVLALALVAAAAGAGCGQRPRAFGVHDHRTRALVRIDYDHDGDGVIDARAYMRDGRPVRLETDADRDGVVDRWEYYDASGALLQVGISTAGDGREDAWVQTTGVERRVSLSTRRDNVIDRREIYRGDTLAWTETDTNGDGLPDAWEDFEAGTLARLRFDHEKRHGRPTRRIVYRGGNARVEAIDGGAGGSGR